MSVIASVIVPTRNRVDSLSLTLRSLLAQRVQAEYEVLIVDNASTDNTRCVAQRAIRANPERLIRYLYEPVAGSLSARHRGVMEATSDLLIFTDDDIEASPDWLEALLNAFNDPAVQIVGGPILPTYEEPPPDWLWGFWTVTRDGGRMCTWLGLLDLGDHQTDVDPTFVWSLNLAIRRTALFAAGGFHPDYFPDNLHHWQGDGETGLGLEARRLGLRAVYEPRAIVRHRIPMSRLTPQYFEQRAYFQGICDSYTAIRTANPGHSAPGSTCSWASFRLMQHAKTPVGWVRSFVRRAWRNWPGYRDLADIRGRIVCAYDAGFKFHQSAAHTHPEILEWVLREDYWDYRLPRISGLRK